MSTFFFPSRSQVLFGGSRSLPASCAGLVGQVVGAAVSAGASVHVGCAAGADLQVIQAVVSAGAARRALSLFCVGTSGGFGFWSGSAPWPVLLGAWQAGASVRWQAGGGLAVSFAGRLMARSMAALSGCSLAVFFLASPGSPGSLKVAAQAVKRHIPVLAFACGFSGSPAPLAGLAGSWQPASIAGFSCWAWQPSIIPAPRPAPAGQLSLF